METLLERKERVHKQQVRKYHRWLACAVLDAEEREIVRIRGILEMQGITEDATLLARQLKREEEYRTLMGVPPR